MKTYTAKFECKQPVFVILNKGILESIISQVKITDRQGYKELNEKTHEYEDVSLLIQYLIPGKYDESRHILPYEWYPEKDIFETKEELLLTIK